MHANGNVQRDYRKARETKEEERKVSTEGTYQGTEEESWQARTCFKDQEEPERQTQGRDEAEEKGKQTAEKEYDLN